MGDVFLGEARALPFGFTPAGWAPCNGQLLPIGQYTALYSLLGNMYGGDGENTYGLPNLAPLSSSDGGTLHYCIAVQGMYPQQG